MLRLTGLPSPKRYPHVTVTNDDDHIELLFTGPNDTTSIEVDVRLLGAPPDLEMVILDLLAKLQAQGYDARWERAS